jgi:hypothetical protein
MDLEDLQPSFLIGNPDLYLPVKPAPAPECRIDGVRQVGRSNDNDLASALKAVHQGKELGNHTPFDFSFRLFAFWGD